MSKTVVTLDVREDLRLGHEPFSKIMQAVGALRDSEDLLLIAPFEPAPLFAVLAQRGFSHQARATETGDCEVLFTRTPATESAPPAAGQAAQNSRAAKPGSCGGPPALDVDARGLEPPQPLQRILEAVAALPAGVRLRARTDRRPMHLYAQLEERGFIGETEEQTDGSFLTCIRPASE